MKKSLKAVNQVDRNLNMDNFQEAMMGAESKFANVFHGSVDWKNFNYELPMDISRYDVDLLDGVMMKID